MKDPSLKAPGAPRERLAPWLKKRLPRQGTVQEVTGHTTVVEAHQTPGGVVFLERFESFSGRGGKQVEYSLTNAIPVTGGPRKP